MMSDIHNFSDFRTFTRRLTLTGALRAETALRVGSGQPDELSGADMAVMKDADRRPFIPGSSFKGALRAHVERLVRGLWPESDARLAACDPLTDDGRCISNTDIQDLRRKADRDPDKLAQAIWQRSCRVCRVFGSPWLASKVLFKDLTLKHPEFWFERGYQVRAGVGIERDSDAAQEGVLYTGETVPPGTEFAWEIVIENADQHNEEPLVFLGLQEMKNGHVPMGGSKSRGLGRVSLKVEKATLVDQSTLVDYLISGEPQPVDWEMLAGHVPGLVRSLAGSPPKQEASHA